ncbi:MAG TPA: glycosyltransferase family 4 protein [Pyrinomonadaceae bacterium]|jgi:glycosyltransferase involved in cell wall biosynthesis
MKILFYNHTGQVSGAERMLLLILSRLERSAIEPLVICPEQGPLQQMADELGVKVASVSGLEARFTWRPDQLLRYLKSFFGVIRHLRRTVVSIQPELLHANSIRAGLVATAATIGLGTRVLWHLHDLLPQHPLSTLIRALAAGSSRTEMIAVSEAVARNFRGRWSRFMKDHVSVILNAIDLNKFQPDRTAKKRIRQQLRFRKHDLVVGMVGQLTPRKGQLELLRAFGVALAQAPNTVLLIAGAPLFNRDHEYLELLKRTASELGISHKVRMLGARDDIELIMQSLDLLVVNSKAEPFGLVILEAMACGTPVLAAAVDGIPEIINHGENGWLVSAENEVELAEAMVNLGRQSGLRERMAERGRQHVVAHFSADRYLAELQTFYVSRANLKLTKSSPESTSRHAESAKFTEIAVP